MRVRSPPRAPETTMASHRCGAFAFHAVTIGTRRSRRRCRSLRSAPPARPRRTPSGSISRSPPRPSRCRCGAAGCARTPGAAAAPRTRGRCWLEAEAWSLARFACGSAGSASPSSEAARSPEGRVGRAFGRGLSGKGRRSEPHAGVRGVVRVSLSGALRGRHRAHQSSPAQGLLGNPHRTAERSN